MGGCTALQWLSIISIRQLICYPAPHLQLLCFPLTQGHFFLKAKQWALTFLVPAHMMHVQPLDVSNGWEIHKAGHKKAALYLLYAVHCTLLIAFSYCGPFPDIWATFVLHWPSSGLISNTSSLITPWTSCVVLWMDYYFPTCQNLCMSFHWSFT